TLQQAPAHERAQTKADRIENPMIARHFFEIDKGMERVFAHSPHMPASAIPKITQTLPRSSRRPPIPRALPNPTRKVAKAIPHPPITSRQTAASFSFGPMRNAYPSPRAKQKSGTDCRGVLMNLSRPSRATAEATMCHGHTNAPAARPSFRKKLAVELEPRLETVSTGRPIRSFEQGGRPVQP